MSKYRKKPVVIDAVRFTKHGLLTADEWFWDAVSKGDVRLAHFYDHSPNPAKCKIKTLEGVMTANEGDYIIRGVNGEIYPCKADIFKKTYEAVTDDE